MMITVIFVSVYSSYLDNELQGLILVPSIIFRMKVTMMRVMTKIVPHVSSRYIAIINVLQKGLCNQSLSFWKIMKANPKATTLVLTKTWLSSHLCKITFCSLLTSTQYREELLLVLHRFSSRIVFIHDIKLKDLGETGNEW